VNRSGPGIAIIPCWNEAATLGPLVERVREHVPAVLVVDDGSTDATAACARAAGARVESHPGNLGKGAALRTGLGRAVGTGATWAITLDGDGQHDPAAIPDLQRRAAETGAALVVGNRMAAASQMPWLRRSTNRWMSRLLSQRAGIPLPDSQCGFRWISLAAWGRLQPRCSHFEVESETLLAFVAAGFRVEFVPVPVIAAARPSRIRPLADTLRWWRWWRRSVPLPSGAEARRSPGLA
jgi:glycosyltransferase involved in cell wall biosynthesis